MLLSCKNIKLLLISITATFFLLLIATNHAHAAFRATGMIQGLLCDPMLECDEIKFDDTKTPGNLTIAEGSVFDAVTSMDQGKGTCLIDLQDTKLKLLET